MKFILLSAAGTALAAMVVYDAVQVPPAESIFGEAVAWLGGEVNDVMAEIGIHVLTSERGQQLASPGDWIVGNADGPIHVLDDSTFKVTYGPAPDGAGVPDAAPATPAGNWIVTAPDGSTTTYTDAEFKLAYTAAAPDAPQAAA